MRTLSTALFLFVGLAALVLLATVLAPELCHVGEGQKGNRHGLERRGLGGSGGGGGGSVSSEAADNEIRFLRKELAVMKAQRRAFAAAMGAKLGAGGSGGGAARGVGGVLDDSGRGTAAAAADALPAAVVPALLQEPRHSAPNMHVPLAAPTAPAVAAGALAAQAASIAPTTGAAVRTSNGGSPASPTPPAFPASLPSPTSPASQASSASSAASPASSLTSPVSPASPTSSAASLASLASPASPAAASAPQRFGAECAAHFHVLPGADISGMDLFSSSTIAASPSACCSACAAQGRNCGGAVLVGDKCWLKRQGVVDHIKRTAGACDDPNPRTVTFISLDEAPHFPTLVSRCPMDQTARTGVPVDAKEYARILARPSSKTQGGGGGGGGGNHAARGALNTGGAAASTSVAQPVSPACPAEGVPPAIALKERLTVVMATSPRPAGPCILHIRSALRSLFLRLPELLAVKLMISYDGCPVGKPLYWESVRRFDRFGWRVNETCTLTFGHPVGSGGG